MANQTFYGTKQVAEILGIPEWRVKNFAEGSAYGLPPTQKLGMGRGSRRLYDFSGILRVAIATELVSFGFMPETVGKAMSKVQDVDVLKIAAKARTSRSDDWSILVCIESKWDLQKTKSAEKLVTKALENEKDWLGAFAMNISSLVACVQKKIEACSGQRQSEE
jgi:hypothetical protein